MDDEGERYESYEFIIQIAGERHEHFAALSQTMEQSAKTNDKVKEVDAVEEMTLSNS